VVTSYTETPANLLILAVVFRITWSALVLLIVTAIAISVNSIPPSLANHGDEGISNYIWSRANSDGHRSLLNCEDPPNADRCDIEYEIASNIANIAGHLTATQISNEAANSE